MRDVIIIGDGPAAYTAAIYCARAGLNTLINYNTISSWFVFRNDLVHEWPGRIEPIKIKDLLNEMEEQAINMGAEVRVGPNKLRARCTIYTPEKILGSDKLFSLEDKIYTEKKVSVISAAEGCIAAIKCAQYLEKITHPSKEL